MQHRAAIGSDDALSVDEAEGMPPVLAPHELVINSIADSDGGGTTCKSGMAAILNLEDYTLKATAQPTEASRS